MSLGITVKVTATILAPPFSRLTDAGGFPNFAKSSRHPAPPFLAAPTASQTKINFCRAIASGFWPAIKFSRAALNSFAVAAFSIWVMPAASRALIIFNQPRLKFRREIINFICGVLISCREALNFCRSVLFSASYAKSGSATAKYPNHAKTDRPWWPSARTSRIWCGSWLNFLPLFSFLTINY